MCRFLCYIGPEIFLSDLLYSPKNSLILQSYKSKERKEPLNGDGFGVEAPNHLLMISKELEVKVELVQEKSRSHC